MNNQGKENLNNLLPITDVCDTLIHALSTSQDYLFFIQIGSNDATHGDSLNMFLKNEHWHGILVEPVSYVFDRLRAKYGSSKRFILENVAIAEVNSTKEFYYIEQSTDNLPSWYDQLGSFSLPIIMKHTDFIPDLEKRIKKTNIECITFQALCDRHSVKSIDIIHIDTEGFDYEILKLIDFKYYKPVLLIYEHKHLSEIDKAASQKFLADKGYEVLEVNSCDTISVFSEVLEKKPLLKRSWKSVSKEIGGSNAIW